jgi:hypothetical protein
VLLLRCRVVAGQRRRMLNEAQTTGMLQFAGLSPAIRGQYLQDVVARKDLGGFNEGELAWCCFGAALMLLTTLVVVNCAKVWGHSVRVRG